MSLRVLKKWPSHRSPRFSQGFKKIPKLYFICLGSQEYNFQHSGLTKFDSRSSLVLRKWLSQYFSWFYQGFGKTPKTLNFFILDPRPQIPNFISLFDILQNWISERFPRLWKSAQNIEHCCLRSKTKISNITDTKWLVPNSILFIKILQKRLM